MSIQDEIRASIGELRARPAFAVATIATLAVGLGANTAIFTLVHALMFRTLPVERPHELVRLGETMNCCVNSGLQDNYSLFSTRLYEQLRDASRDELADVTAFSANTPATGVRRAGTMAAESMSGQFVSASYFATLGVKPAAGRLMLPSDDDLAAPTVAVLSYDAWRRQFGLDPTIVGASATVFGTALTIVGVAADGFFGEAIRPNPAGIWLPLGHEPRLRGSAALQDRPDQDWLYVIGRLRPDGSPERLAARATATLQQWLTDQPFVSAGNRPAIARQRIGVISAASGVGIMRSQFGQPLTILLATSGLVLLITAANLANLLLARADRGQAAIKVALGASRGHLVRQSLIGGVLLALVGGAVGVGVAMVGVPALVALAFPGGIVVPVDSTPSAGVLAFATTVATVVGALFTAGPAWAMAGTSPLGALGGVGRGGHDRSFVPRRLLTVTQVALSLLLLSGAALLARSLANLESQPLNFDPDHRYVVRLTPPAWAGQTARLERLYESLRERVARIPGVTAATYSMYTPMEGNNWSSSIAVAGHTRDPQQSDSTSWNRVGPDYFAVVGTSLLAGRLFDARDGPTGRRVAIVNEAFTRRFLGDANPVGQTFGFGDASRARDWEIVGIVADVKYTAAAEPVRPMAFLPAFQTVDYPAATQTSVQARSMLMPTMVVDTRAEVRDLELSLRRAMAEVEPDVVLIRVTAMRDQVAGNFRLQRLMARVTSFYGLLALALAALGLYAVTSYTVSRRTREIGVRMALGAGHAQVVRTMLWAPLVQTLIGIGIGLPLALGATRAIGGQLYGIGAYDPSTFASTIAVLIVSGLLAAAIPARRAASTDPTKALRGE